MRHAGDTQQQNGKTFVGTADPAACVRLLDWLVYKVDPSRCHPKPCAIGAFYQPSLPPDMDFYTVGSFVHTLNAVGAIDNRGRYLPRVGFEKALEYCQKVHIITFHLPISVTAESDFAYRYQYYYRSVVCLFSVCLSRSCIVLKRQKISTRFLLHTTATSLPDCINIWLTSVNPSSSNFAQNWPTPVDLSVRDIRWQTAADWLKIAHWSQWRAYIGNQCKPPSLV